MALSIRRSVTAACAALVLLGGLSSAAPGPVLHGTSSLAGTTGVLAAATTATPYRALQLLSSGPVRWNPCQSVRWAFNPVGAPSGGFDVARAAVRRVSQLTGLHFQYMGMTHDALTSSYLNQAWGHAKPLLIGWSTASRSDLLAGTGPRHVGETRVSWAGVPSAQGVKGELLTGLVVFNSASRAALTGPNSRYTYALHEMGHAVGLAHVNSAANLMSTVLPVALRDYGPGDRAGLARVGSLGGCLPNLR